MDLGTIATYHEKTKCAQDTFAKNQATPLLFCRDLCWCLMTNKVWFIRNWLVKGEIQMKIISLFLLFIALTGCATTKSDELCFKPSCGVRAEVSFTPIDISTQNKVFQQMN